MFYLWSHFVYFLFLIFCWTNDSSRFRGTGIGTTADTSISEDLRIYKQKIFVYFIVWILAVNSTEDVILCTVGGSGWSDSEVKVSEVKWVTVKFLGKKVPCTLGWPYTEGTWLYCDYFIWCVSCTVVVLTCFVICGVCMCGFCNVWVYVCGFCNVWVCMDGFCNVWVCVCVSFVMCWCVYVWVFR